MSEAWTIVRLVMAFGCYVTITVVASYRVLRGGSYYDAMVAYAASMGLWTYGDHLLESASGENPE